MYIKKFFRCHFIHVNIWFITAERRCNFPTDVFKLSPSQAVFSPAADFNSDFKQTPGHCDHSFSAMFTCTQVSACAGQNIRDRKRSERCLLMLKISLTKTETNTR